MGERSYGLATPAGSPPALGALALSRHSSLRSQVFLSLRQQGMGLRKIRQPARRNLQVNDRSLVIAAFQQTGSHFVVCPGRVRLQFNRGPQIFDGLRIFLPGGPAPLPSHIAPDTSSRPSPAPVAGWPTALSGFPLSSSASADRTLLAVAIPSFGSTPVAAALAGDADFCRPTYPSEASFCISLEVSSGPPAASAGAAEAPVECIQLRRRWSPVWLWKSAPGCAWRRDRPTDRRAPAWAPGCRDIFPHATTPARSTRMRVAENR